MVISHEILGHLIRRMVIGLTFTMNRLRPRWEVRLSGDFVLESLMHTHWSSWPTRFRCSFGETLINIGNDYNLLLEHRQPRLPTVVYHISRRACHFLLQISQLIRLLSKDYVPLGFNISNTIVRIACELKNFQCYFITTLGFSPVLHSNSTCLILERLRLAIVKNGGQAGDHSLLFSYHIHVSPFLLPHSSGIRIVMFGDSCRYSQGIITGWTDLLLVILSCSIC